MRIAIVGCGLIGGKRAAALSPDDHLVACCDARNDAAEKMASDYQCHAFTDYKAMLAEIDCDAVVVAVINKFIQPVVIAALESGRHALAEKPLGRNAQEAQSMADKAREKNLILKTGFNHRFHPAVWQAHQMAAEGKIGPLLFVRGRYGHGGRPGMEKEWRSSPDLCGGGELLDQGVHLIDLSRWFCGDMARVFGTVKTKYWPIEVEDNAFVQMESRSGIDVQLQVSWCNWKNIFCLELFGRDGYLMIEGLGGSYGTETLTWGVRKPEGGRPEIRSWEFPGPDQSWQAEWREFSAAIAEHRPAIGSGRDGWEANRIIQAIYRSYQLKCQVELD